MERMGGVAASRRAEEAGFARLDALAHLAEAVVVTDPDGRVTYANEAAETLLGESAWAELSSGLPHVAVLAEALDGTPVRRRDVRVRAEGRAETGCEANASPIRDGQGAVIGAVATFRPIGRSDELRRSDERFHLVARATQDVVWDWDVTTGRVWRNANFEENFGWRKGEVEEGRGQWVARLHPDDRARVERSIRDVMADPELEEWTDEYRYLRADGTFAHVLDRAYVCRDPSGAPARLIGCMADITERKQHEESTRRQKELYETVVRAQGDLGQGIMLASGLRILYVNQQFARITGYQVDELLAPDFDLRSLWAPEDEEENLRHLDELRRGVRGSLHWHRRLKRRDGTFLVVEIAAAPLRDPPGSRIVLARDVSNELAARQELAEARIALAQREKLAALGGLVGGVAHEVRTPLTVLQNSTYLLERRIGDTDAGRVAPLVDAIRDSVARIGGIVDELRRFTQMQPAVRRVSALQGIVSEAIALFASTHRGVAGVDARLDTTPPVLVDSGQLQQVVLNLLENASDAVAGTSGSITIRTRRSKDGRHAVLEVEDGGRGMPPHVQARMFEELFTTKAHGTGLGLSIVRRIVEEHGGAIHVESEEGVGTLVSLTFPASREGAPPGGAEPLPQEH